HALSVNLGRERARRRAGTKSQSGNNRGRRIVSGFVSDSAATFERNRPVLKSLSQRFKLGIVSNFYGNLKAVCEGAGLGDFFQVMVDSHSVGAKKPDPAIFRAALEGLGATPEKTVLIGDSLRRDWEGARRLGMRFIWIAPQDVLVAKSERYAESAVTDLRDLAKVLQ